MGSVLSILLVGIAMLIGIPVAIVLAAIALVLALVVLAIAILIVLSPILVIALVIFLIVRASKKKKAAETEKAKEE